MHSPFERGFSVLAALVVVGILGFVLTGVEFVSPKIASRPQTQFAQAASSPQLNTTAPKSCMEAIQRALGKENDGTDTSKDVGTKGTVDNCYGAVLKPGKQPSQNPSDYQCTGRGGTETVTSNSVTSVTTAEMGEPVDKCDVKITSQPPTGGSGGEDALSPRPPETGQQSGQPPQSGGSGGGSPPSPPSPPSGGGDSQPPQTPPQTQPQTTPTNLQPNTPTDNATQLAQNAQKIDDLQKQLDNINQQQTDLLGTKNDPNTLTLDQQKQLQDLNTQKTELSSQLTGLQADQQSIAKNDPSLAYLNQGTYSANSTFDQQANQPGSLTSVTNDPNVQSKADRASGILASADTYFKTADLPIAQWTPENNPAPVEMPVTTHSIDGTLNEAWQIEGQNGAAISYPGQDQIVGKNTDGSVDVWTQRDDGQIISTHYTPEQAAGLSSSDMLDDSRARADTYSPQTNQPVGQRDALLQEGAIDPVTGLPAQQSSAPGGGASDGTSGSGTAQNQNPFAEQQATLADQIDKQKAAIARAFNVDSYDQVPPPSINDGIQRSLMRTQLAEMQNEYQKAQDQYAELGPSSQSAQKEDVTSSLPTAKWDVNASPVPYTNGTQAANPTLIPSQDGKGSAQPFNADGTPNPDYTGAPIPDKALSDPGGGDGADAPDKAEPAPKTEPEPKPKPGPADPGGGGPGPGGGTPGGGGSPSGGGGSPSGGGGGSPLSALGSFLSGLANALKPQPQQPQAQTCSTDPTIYAQQQQQYQQQLQQYNYQQQQYQYQQQLNDYYAQRGQQAPPPPPGSATPPVQPAPCTPGTGSQCQNQPTQPPASSCNVGAWKPTMSGVCITGWQCVPNDTNACIQTAPIQPDAAQCPNGTWQKDINASGCWVGWKCSATGATSTPPTTPEATLSCQPAVADVGMTLAIAYSCSSGTAAGTGFTVGTQPSGSATATVANPPAGANTATYSLTCTDQGLTAGAQCSVQVGKPSIVLVANPKTVASGAITLIGWITTGMKSCVVSSPDDADFTSRNAYNTSPGGTATSSPITASTKFVLDCQTVAGATKQASISVAVGGSNPNGSVSVSSNAEGKTIHHGDSVKITWSAGSEPAGSAVSLWLVDPETNYTTALIAGGLSLSGSYTWTLPATGSACGSDAHACAKDLVAGHQYQIEADVYTPSNAYIGDGARATGAPDPQYGDLADTKAFTLGQ